MTAWFPIFASVALKSAAIWGLAWLASLLLRRRSAAARHLVWTAAAAAVIALPILSVWMPALPIPVAGAPADAISFVFRLTATQRGQAAVPLVAAQPRVTPTPTQPVRGTVDWRLGLMLLWIAGAAAASAQTLLTYVGVWRLRRAAAPWPDRRLPIELGARLGVSHPVDVLETHDGAMPMTFGILRPTIFLPRDATKWSEERRRIVLLHELAHVRRGDTATQLLARLTLIGNWWNPLAWKAWSEFLKERERATDDMVLRAGESAVNYATHLLELAQAAPSLGWAAVAMARRSQLEGRLAFILDPGVRRNATGRVSTLAMALVAVALVIPLAAVRAQEPAAPSAGVDRIPFFRSIAPISQLQSSPVPADVDATIRAAIAQKNHLMAEKAAAAFEDLRQYETAAKLLESAVAIRQEVSGAQSVEYGVGLIKLGDLERKRRRINEADSFYTKAVQILGDHPEAAPALLNLGISALHRNPAQAAGYFEQAAALDPSVAGKAKMWLALIQERQENWAEAESLFQSAIAAQRPNSAEYATTRELYARFLLGRGRDEEAKINTDLAALIRKMLEAERVEIPSSSEVLRAGDSVLAPRLVSKVEPEYTDEARFAKHSGAVLITAEIGTDGLAHNIHVKKGIGLGLDENAVSAITQWHFKPGTRDGNPVTVQANIEVNFRLM